MSKNINHSTKIKLDYLNNAIWDTSMALPRGNSFWKITDGKRTICGYVCRKAIWEANDSTKIYAWFCNELMPSVGPESILGLPGAILGVATEDGGVVYFAKSVEVANQETNKLLPPKTKQKIYKTHELKTQFEKDYGKEKWGKAMIYNNFEIW